MKIAIIHDDLMRRGGAEQVAIALHKAFPDAPIYTLCYRPDLTYPEFRDANIITSWYQKIVFTEGQMKKLFFPLGFWAMRSLKVEGYDKVILSSTFASKYANVEKGTEVINYCHNPFRIAWYPETYESYRSLSGVKKKLYDFILQRLRNIDYKYARKADRTIVNSMVVQERVKQVYGISDSKVINPPVNLSKFQPASSKSNNFLVVSRFEAYKRVDLAIKAFNKLKLPLTIVGNGSQKKYLKSIANENITFKESLSAEQLCREYATARALIFPQEEDFGITPLEANASGTPVIAYGRGGVLETIIPHDGENINKSTGIFFQEQTEECLIKAIERFEAVQGEFQERTLVSNARRFSLEEFSKRIREEVFLGVV